MTVGWLMWCSSTEGSEEGSRQLRACQSDMGTKERHRADHPERHCMAFAGQPSWEASPAWTTWSHPMKWVIHLTNEGKALNIVCFFNIFHSILLGNLDVHVLDLSSAHWVKNCLDDWSEGVAEWSYIQLVASNYKCSPGISIGTMSLISWSRIWIRGLSTFSKSADELSWVGVLICCSLGRRCRGMWTEGENNSMRFNKYDNGMVSRTRKEIVSLYFALMKLHLVLGASQQEHQGAGVCPEKANGERAAGV